MDPQQIEILQQNRNIFLQTVDLERILPFLKEDEVLDITDIARISAPSTAGERLETLLDMLPGKGAQAYSTFCLALENTYPQLLTAMLRSQHQGHEIPPSRSHIQEPVSRSSPRQEKLQPPPIPPMPMKRSESYGRGDGVGRADSFGRNEPTRRSESFGKGEQQPPIVRNDSFSRTDPVSRTDSFGRADPTLSGDAYGGRADPNAVMRSDSQGRGDHASSRGESFRSSDPIRRNDSFTRTEQAVRGGEPFSRNDPANRSDSFGRGDASKRMNFARGDQTRRSESFGRSDHTQEQLAMMRAHHNADAAKMSRGSHGQEAQGHRNDLTHRSGHSDRKDSTLERRHHGQERSDRAHGQDRHHKHDRIGSDPSSMERKSLQDRPHAERQHVPMDLASIPDRRSHETSTLERRCKSDRRVHHGGDTSRHHHSQDIISRTPHLGERSHSKDAALLPHPSLIPDRIPKMPAQHPHSLEMIGPLRGKPLDGGAKTRVSAGKLPSPLDRSPCNPEPPPLPSVPPPNMVPMKESRGTPILEDEEDPVRSHAGILGLLPTSVDESHVSSGPRSYPRTVSVQDYPSGSKPCRDDVSLLRAEIKLLPGVRDELELGSVSYKRPSPTMNPELAKPAGERVGSNHNYDWLKSQCDWAMKELVSLKQQHGETMKKCDTAVKDAEFHRMNYRATKEKNDQYQTEILHLKAACSQALAEKERLEKDVCEQQKQLDDDQREMVQLRQQQKEAMSESGSTADHNFSVLYDTYVNRYEAVKQEYTALKKNYTDALSSLNVATSRADLLQEENARFRKDLEVLEKEHHVTLKECKLQKTHITAAIQTYNREKSDLLKELQGAKLERDEYKRKISQAMAGQIKTTKEYALLKKERDAVVHEYTLVMSERDSVHKEIEQLQDKLAGVQKKNEMAEAGAKSAYKDAGKLRQEVAAGRQERDHAIKQYNDMKDRLSGGGGFPEAMEIDRKRRESLLKEMDKMRSELELRDAKRGLGPFDRAVKDVAESKEAENLRKEVERLQAELTENVQEAERAKQDRNWAFVERDKIVRERESIRTLCDKLRHERDNAVSKLIEAVRDSDELKKQKSDALKELKDYKDKYDALNEREARKNQLHAIGHNHSRDSAIDADLQEWETETLELEISGANADDLGFDLTRFGREDPQIPYDCFVVRSIRQDSFAFGKIKENDHLLNVNGVDVSNADKPKVLQAIKQGGANVNMVVRRRKLVSTRAVFPVTINMSPDRDLGVNIEQGLYVSRIVTGSAAAREGNLAVGDRILYVNDRSVEHLSVTDVLRIALESDRVTFNVVKYCPTPQPSMTSTSSMSSAQAFTESSPEACSTSPRSQHSNSRIWISPSPDSADDNKVPSSTNNIKNSCGSQTDSLDSQPAHAHTHTHLEPSEPDQDKMNMNIFGKAINSIVRPFRSVCTKDASVRDSSCKSGHQLSAPADESDTDKAEEEVIESLNNIIEEFSMRSPILSPNVPNMASKPAKGKAEKERKASKRSRRENGGTWPKCHSPLDAHIAAGWPRVIPKKERAPLPHFGGDNKAYVTSPKSSSALVNVPPKPPERSDSFQRRDSFTRTVKHSPQSSDSSVKYAVIHNLPTTGTSSYGSSPCKDSHGHGKGAAKSHGQAQPPHHTQAPDKAESVGSGRSKHGQEASDVDRGHETAAPIHFPTHSSSEASTPTHSAHAPDLSVKSGNESDITLYLKRKTEGRRERDRPRSATDRRRRPASETGYRDYPQKPTSLDIQPMYSPRPIPSSRGQPIPTSHSNGHTSHSMSPGVRTMVLPSPTRSLSPREMSPAYKAKSPHYMRGSPAPCQMISSINPPVYVADSRRTGEPTCLSPPPYSDRRGGTILTSSIPEMDSHHAPVPVYLRGGGKHELPRYSASPSPSPSQQSGSLDDFQHPQMKHRPPYGRNSADFPLPDFTQRRPPYPPGDRFKIPSSSVSSISTSSYERMSIDRTSPISPAFWPGDYPHTPGTSSSLPLPKPRRPELGEKRDIKVEKGSENLGIQIECGSRGGIFVSSVSENSLASKAGLAVGDQLLEVCGINMRGATKEVAASVLRQCGGSVNMRVQYNPDKYRGEVTSSTDNESSDESPCDTPRRPRKAPHRISNETITPETCSPTSLSPNTLSPNHSAISGENFPTPVDPRVLILKKSHSQNELGVTIAGGNNTGIFVQGVKPNSIAARNGLRGGDQILMMNGVNFRNITAEQASLEIAKPTDNYYIRAQYNIAKYEKVNSMPWDDIFVRAQIDRPAENEGELPFQKGDILCVDSTVYNGHMGLWRAWLVDDDGKKVHGGAIPSKARLEEELASRRSISEADDELKGSRRGSASARRSFFRRKKHQRNNSKDSREFNSFSDASINSDSVPFLADDGSVLTFERVERLDSIVYRPVLILGALGDPLVSKLNSESPDKYCRCAPEVIKATMASMETGHEDGDIIDFKPLSDGQFECLSVQAIKDIIDKNRHAMLVVHPTTIESLHKARIYPIVLFIRHKSAKQIREVKDTRFWPDKMTNKNAKELFETFSEYEQKYKRFFSDIIPGGNLAMMGYKIKSAIDKEQKKTVWVPSGSL